MTHLIESLAREISRLEPCSGESRQAYTVAKARIHLARGPRDTIELFVEGDRASFGLAAVGHSLEWGTFYDLKGSRNFPALVVRTQDGDSAVRLMAHLAYEAARLVEHNPHVTNSELLEQLTPFISLVIQRSILSVQYQMGLTSELMLLLELLNFAERQDPPLDQRLALAAWKGWDSASRDFSGIGVAVEVKATSHDSRRHSVHPMRQLLPDPSRPDERVYIYSVGLRPDRSNSFRVLTAFDRVFARLDSDAQHEFAEKLGRYGGFGFHIELRSHYELDPGFSLVHAAALFRVDNVPDILRPESFVGGAPPSRAKRIRYDLLLEGLRPAPPQERDTVFRQLLQQL